MAAQTKVLDPLELASFRWSWYLLTRLPALFTHMLNAGQKKTYRKWSESLNTSSNSNAKAKKSVSARLGAFCGTETNVYYFSMLNVSLSTCRVSIIYFSWFLLAFVRTFENSYKYNLYLLEEVLKMCWLVINAVCQRNIKNKSPQHFPAGNRKQFRGWSVFTWYWYSA